MHRGCEGVLELAQQLVMMPYVAARVECYGDIILVLYAKALKY